MFYKLQKQISIAVLIFLLSGCINSRAIQSEIAEEFWIHILNGEISNAQDLLSDKTINMNAVRLPYTPQNLSISKPYKVNDVTYVVKARFTTEETLTVIDTYLVNKQFNWQVDWTLTIESLVPTTTQSAIKSIQKSAEIISQFYNDKHTLNADLNSVQQAIRQREIFPQY